MPGTCARFSSSAPNGPRCAIQSYNSLSSTKASAISSQVVKVTAVSIAPPRRTAGSVKAPRSEPSPLAESYFYLLRKLCLSPCIVQEPRPSRSYKCVHEGIHEHGRKARDDGVREGCRVPRRGSARKPAVGEDPVATAVAEMGSGGTRCVPARLVPARLSSPHELTTLYAGILPVPPSQRTDTHYSKVFFVFFSANCNILSYVICFHH